MNKDIYIYGAHSRSQTLGVYLNALYKDIKIIAYLVDNDEDNPVTVNGVPVIHLSEQTQLRKEVTVYLGTRGVYHPAIIERLKRYGVSDIIPVTPALDIELRNKYMRMDFARTGRSFAKFDELQKRENGINVPMDNDVSVYVAKSIYDTPITEQYELKTWERLLQVGCALSDRRLSECEFYDNTGDNISAYNNQFCEVTGLYWVWKNTKEDIVGLCHYRRHFLFEDDWVKTMVGNDVDVILPVPLFVAPSLAENYRMRHTEITWNAMRDVLKRNTSEFQRAEDYYENNGCYSPCNMFIMKRQVLNELCTWMFPILFEVADRIGVIDDDYQNRYPGFLSERLMTFYFYEHSDKYNVVYTDKNFLG